MKKSFRILTIVLLFGGCNIIFEEDLSEEIVTINMPLDGTVTLSQSQLFWWEMLDDALGYKLQIVQGSFADPDYLVVDTNATADKFLLHLDPGEYEWRIKGWNNFSETRFLYQVLTIEDSANYEE